MSLRLDMQRAARRASNILGEAAALVRQFLLSQWNPDGGFRNRAGASDLYYTVFGVEGLLALQAEFPLETLISYLDSFDTGETCDFVHLCCLARCWAAVQAAAPSPGLRVSPGKFSAIAQRLSDYRSLDGGFHSTPHSAQASAYASFLALGAWQDCGLALPAPLSLAEAVKRLEMPEGGFANERCSPVGGANATAAALAVLHQLRQPVSPKSVAWLLDCCWPTGGFCAVPRAPIPDLLSTAVALHALAEVQADISALREPCLNFVDSLWTNAGSFHGHWGDDHLDTEYTYYGLLALGHLNS